MTVVSRNRIVVTGACGFIGSHLVEALIERGASRVRALVRYEPRGSVGLLGELSPSLRDAVEVVAGDVRDPHLVDRLIEGADVVFHLAAQISVAYSYAAPRDFFETNVLGTLNVLEAARRHGVGRVVHTSSSETYGSAQYLPMDERHPLVAQSPYAASKIGADKAVESFGRAYSLPVVTVRPFNTYGPRQSARAIVPSLLSQALSGRALPLRVGALDPVRDLVYVSDTVDGFLAAGERDGVEGEVFNLGTGVGTRIGDLAEAVVELVGGDGKIEQEARRLRPRTSEVDRLVADATAARDRLGWHARVPLAEGLRRTAAWITAHPEAFRTDDHAV